MNKRDVIIISILINAGLLAVLFFTASHEPAPPIPIAKEEKIPSPPSIVVPENKESEELVTTKREEKPVAYVLPSIVEKKEEEKKEEKHLQLPKSFASTKEVRVSPGDTLGKIAKTHHTTSQKLMTLNGLSDTFLRVGQVLKVPVNKAKEKKARAFYYIVKSGDNPWTIAMKHHIKVEELLKLNHLDEKTARRLKPGDKLRIR